MSKHRNGEEAAPNSAPLCDTELSEQDRDLLKDALDDASRVPETLHRDIMDAVQREKAPKKTGAFPLFGRFPIGTAAAAVLLLCILVITRQPGIYQEKSQVSADRDGAGSYSYGQAEKDEAFLPAPQNSTANGAGGTESESSADAEQIISLFADSDTPVSLVITVSEDPTALLAAHNLPSALLQEENLWLYPAQAADTLQQILDEEQIAYSLYPSDTNGTAVALTVSE